MSNVNARLGHFRSVDLVRSQKIVSDLKLSCALKTFFIHLGIVFSKNPEIYFQKKRKK